MTVAIVGGLDRLAPHYAALAKEHEGLEIRVFSRYKPALQKRIATADGVVLCTDLISHRAAREVYRLARADGIALACSHRSSVSAVRQAIETLTRGCGCEIPCPGCKGDCGCAGSSLRT